MDLRRLAHLVALDDERHFARAAQRVHLSQPAFSRSIQTIESSLGMQVFDRDGGQVRPTAAGEFLLEKARRLLFDARSLRREIELYQDGALGDIAFGVGPFPIASLVSPVLSEMRLAHAQVCLRVEVSNWQRLLERLRSEDIEFFVADVSTLAHTGDLAIQRLGRQMGAAYVRENHPLATRTCTLAELWVYGVISTRLPPMALQALAKRAALSKGQDTALALECDDLNTLKAVTLSTDSVLLATDAAVRAELQSGALRAVQATDLPPLSVEMGVVSLHNRTLSPMAHRVIDCIARVASQINA